MTIFSVFSLLGGIGLFLFGMSIMSTGLRNAAGNNLQTTLEKATKNRFLAILVGAGMTLLIQSSSATDVMVIGFVNAGMMKLTQAIGVIMGANIGTTITAQITAFNLSNFTPLILLVGVILYVFVKKSIVKHIGSVIMGFGMLFQGIIIMKAAITPLAETDGFIAFMDTLSNPLLAFLFGIAFTALLQSSSSSIVIFQAFAVTGLILPGRKPVQFLQQVVKIRRECRRVHLFEILVVWNLPECPFAPFMGRGRRFLSIGNQEGKEE